MSLDMSSRHSTGPENKRSFGSCFVFSGSYFSAGESLPGTALPLGPGCEHGSPEGRQLLCCTPSFCPPPTAHPTCPKERRELRPQGRWCLRLGSISRVDPV